MHLNLGSIELPLTAATKTFAILAKRGAGKSYTGAVMAEELHIIRNYSSMKNNIRIVPIQHFCVLCGHELQARDATQGLAAPLCHACIQLLHEQVFFRELEQHPKIVRV
jgi:hypothetical protein